MKDRSRIAVIGAGAIGSRHIQAMARVAAPIDLDIVDPLPQARQRAGALVAGEGGLSSGTIREFSRIDELDTAPDLAIVATASRERPQAVQAVVARGAGCLILEKVLFTRLADYDAIDRLLAGAGVRAWVNCPLRAYPRAARLAELIGRAPFSYRVEGQGWGLACNLVHHLDEFAGLAGRGDISLDTAELDGAIAAAKRDGYIEFNGRISAQAGEQNSFVAICNAGPATGRHVQIETGDKSVTVSREQELIIVNGGGARAEPYPMPSQSQMTNRHVEAILAGQHPGLPEYVSASQLHRSMLAAFLGHLRRSMGDDSIDECPIT